MGWLLLTVWLLASQTLVVVLLVRSTYQSVELNDDLYDLLVERGVLLRRVRDLLASDDCYDASDLLDDIDRAVGR